MAEDRDEKKDKAKEAPGEATVVGGMAPPPMAPPPAAPPQKPSESAQPPEPGPSAPNPDATQIGGIAPPPPLPPAAPASPAPADATQIGGIAPPVLPPGPAPGAAAPPAGKPLTVVPGAEAEIPAADDSDRTVIAGAADMTVVGGMSSGDATVVAGIDSATVVGGAMPLATPATLVRLTPPEHKGEVVALDPGRSEYAVGRHEASDIVLYTPSAGRQHARINRGHDGRWYVRPAEGKEVRLGRRSSSDEVALTDGLKITLGDDQFQVKTEPDDAAQGSGGLGSIDATKAILFGVIGLLVIAIVAVLLLR